MNLAKQFIAAAPNDKVTVVFYYDQRNVSAPRWKHLAFYKLIKSSA